MFAGFARGPETYLGQQKDSFPLGGCLPGLNANGIKKGQFQCLQALVYLPMAGCACVQELQYLQAGCLSAAGFGKAMQSSTKAQ